MFSLYLDLLKFKLFLRQDFGSDYISYIMFKSSSVEGQLKKMVNIHTFTSFEHCLFLSIKKTMLQVKLCSNRIM